MTKSDSLRFLAVFCSLLLAAACETASPTAPTEPEPTAPTEPEPEPITLAGNWAGTFTGDFITSDAVTAMLTQTDTMVGGEWSTPMPAALVLLGAPASVNLSGPVTGTVTGTMAELSFGFPDTPPFSDYFAEGCALSLSISSFTATAMDGMWTTNDLCQPPVTDSGTLTLAR